MCILCVCVCSVLFVCVCSVCVVCMLCVCVCSVEKILAPFQSTFIFKENVYSPPHCLCISVFNIATNTCIST